MLIGGDDSNDVITFGTCFFSICLHSRSFSGGNLKAKSTGSHRGIGGGIQIPKT